MTIWHSWVGADIEQLSAIIQSFKQIYPDVTFNLLYVPFDDLFSTYQEAAYLGSGPSLLLGPAKWGASLYDQELVTDLTSFVPQNYISLINPAALVSGEYRDALISLPLSQQGLVMFRNTTLLPTAPTSFDQLTAASLQITHGGWVGSYLERGSYFSSPDILGLGGKLMDESNYPAFNDQYGLEWIDLLSAYDEAGAVTFNTNLDLQMFERGRVGLIIDGTWNIPILSQAIGEKSLAIDPWPTYGTGHLSGWVVADSVYLNSNTSGKDQYAALAFMGYLLDPNVQMRLAEVGHIPSVTTTEPRSPILQQAMLAFSSGVPYPINVDDSILAVYWKELDIALHNIFTHASDPASALKTASDNIIQSLNNMHKNP